MSDQKEEPQVQLTTQQLLQMISDSRIDMARSNARLEENSEAIKKNQERIERLFERAEKHESETNAEFEKVNRRVEAIEEGIAASQEDKASFEERILKVEETAKYLENKFVEGNKKFADNFQEKLVEIGSRFDEGMSSAGGIEERLSKRVSEIERSLEWSKSTLSDHTSQLSTIHPGRWRQGPFDPDEGRSYLRGDIEKKKN